LQQEKGDLYSASLRAYRDMLEQTGLANSTLVERLTAVESQMNSIYGELKTKEEEKEILLAPSDPGSGGSGQVSH
jgi:hypothetical protein